jgi:hypothetical protein
VAAGAQARVRLNQAELRRITRGPDGPVVRHISDLTRRVENRAKRNVKVDEGTLRASIQRVVIPAAGRVIGRVGTGLMYGLYLHEGTGIYGPRGRPIRPVRRKFLRFEVKSGRSAVGRRPVVFAKEVKGVRGDKWLLRALIDVVPYPVTPTP